MASSSEVVGLTGSNHHNPHTAERHYPYPGQCPLEIADQTALLNWCRANLTAAVVVELKASGADALNLSAWRTTHCPSAVATESVMKSVVDAHFHTTGECPAGTQNVVGEKFFIR